MRPVLVLAAALSTVAFRPAPARAADPGADAARAYVIETAGTTERAEVGKPGQLVLFIKPTLAGWKVHPEAPLKIRLQAPAELGLEKATLGRADLADPRAEAPRFVTSFTPTARGRREATAKVDFFICSDAACVKQVKTVPVTIDVG